MEVNAVAGAFERILVGIRRLEGNVARPSDETWAALEQIAPSVGRLA